MLAQAAMCNFRLHVFYVLYSLHYKIRRHFKCMSQSVSFSHNFSFTFFLNIKKNIPTKRNRRFGCRFVEMQPTYFWWSCGLYATHEIRQIVICSIVCIC